MAYGMASAPSLPLPKGRTDENLFRDDLLEFTSNCERWQILCGGVHMLDFLVREPDVYESVLPEDWRLWLKDVDIIDVVDLLNREDVSALAKMATDPNSDKTWKTYSLPPLSLLSYASTIRSFVFDRSFHDWNSRPRQSRIKHLNRQLATGMNEKKRHEVEHFSAFISDMCEEISATTQHQISDVVDFGAGQGYLGRSLASPLYGIDVVSVESKPHNITGARKNDALAKVSKQEVIYRNKKMYRAGVDRADLEKLEMAQKKHIRKMDGDAKEADEDLADFSRCGTVRHIEHKVTSGDLNEVIEKLEFAKSSIEANDQAGKSSATIDTQLMVISLHSCGNLLHHGLRSLTSNDCVKAVAMIGCCYNLCTERIGGPTFKLPNLRFRRQTKRFMETSNACDADGFPMSDHFLNYEHNGEKGIKLNITARMMAVQAPRNWKRNECDDFFTRHWYRALLQRLFLEHGIVPVVDCRNAAENTNADALSSFVQPITIGKLSKHCFKSFPIYVRAALSKLVDEENRGYLFKKLDCDVSDEELRNLEERFGSRKHELCVLWSFMAFSATVVETMIVTDRWQWLQEQKDVARAWVQPVFDYSKSPRNLAVVGIKI